MTRKCSAPSNSFDRSIPLRLGLVVPTLGDRPNLLRECLESIRQQSGIEVSTVVVTTSTSIESIKLLAPDATVIAQTGSGIVDAIQAGWAMFRDDVDAVAWLGDDDRLTPGSLLRGASMLERHPRTAMVYGRCRYIDLSGHPMHEVRPGRAARILIRFGENLIAQPGTLYRRAAILQLGGLDRSLTLAFDVDLHVRLVRTNSCRYIPYVLGEARVHPMSLTVCRRGESQAEAQHAMARQLPPAALALRPIWRPFARLLARLASRVGTR